MVLGLDDAVGCAALAWDVAIHDPLVLARGGKVEAQLQVYEFTAFVLHFDGI